MSNWEKEFWQIVENEGVGANIDFVKHLRNFVAKQRKQLLKEVREKMKEVQYQSPLDIILVVDDLLKKLKELEEGK